MFSRPSDSVSCFGTALLLFGAVRRVRGPGAVDSPTRDFVPLLVKKSAAPVLGEHRPPSYRILNRSNKHVCQNLLRYPSRGGNRGESRTAFQTPQNEIFTSIFLRGEKQTCAL